jgi:positive phototaxis protein PixI
MSLNSVSENQPDIAQSRQQFLRFRLHPDLTAAIEIVSVAARSELRVTELIDISLDRVVPMPHLPAAVLGVYNWRGEILWIVDFGTLLGLNSRQSPQHYRNLKPTIVLSDVSSSGETRSIGLVVAEIEEIEWYETVQLQSLTPNSIHLELATWVKGSWQSAPGEELLLFDSQAIFAGTERHANI